jgi:isocitrate lyase
MRPAQREHSGQFVRQRLTNYFLSHSFTNTLRNSRNSPTADLILYICGSNDFYISGWQTAVGNEDLTRSRRPPGGGQ